MPRIIRFSLQTGENVYLSGLYISRFGYCSVSTFQHFESSNLEVRNVSSWFERVEEWKRADQGPRQQKEEMYAKKKRKKIAAVEGKSGWWKGQGGWDGQFVISKQIV